MTFDLTAPGVYLRCPGGNVENVSTQATAAMWAALNLGTDPCVQKNPAVWDHQRSLYASIGMPCFPWLHCRSIADITFLIGIANAWNAPAIGLNIEDVVDDGLALDVVGPYVRSRWAGPVHMATLAHVQNGQGWEHLGYAVAALELNSEAEIAVAIGEAQHARDEGLVTVTFMYGTKLPASAFDLSICHSLYTADDISPTPTAWAAWVPPPGPCKPPIGGDSVLSPTQKKILRQQIARYCLVAEKYERLWHYSEARPYTGLGDPFSSTHHDDCSAYVALVYYSAARAMGRGVHDPLDEHYSGWGNTETALAFLEAHSAPRNKLLVGDICIFGVRGDLSSQHMQVCRRAGAATKNTNTGSAIFSSFGEESGPEPRQAIYTTKPLIGIYRHPALL